MKLVKHFPIGGRVTSTRAEFRERRKQLRERRKELRAKMRSTTSDEAASAYADQIDALDDQINDLDDAILDAPLEAPPTDDVPDDDDSEPTGNGAKEPRKEKAPKSEHWSRRRYFVG